MKTSQIIFHTVNHKQNFILMSCLQTRRVNGGGNPIVILNSARDSTVRSSGQDARICEMRQL